MNWLINNIEGFDEKLAIVYQKKKYTYRQLFNEISDIKENIFPKIKPGEVVSVLSDYSFESVALLLALYENKNIVGAGFIINLPELKGDQKLISKGIKIHSLMEF